MRWLAVVCAACGVPARQPPDAPPVDTCPQVTITAQPSIPAIELVIDRSGSMIEDFGGVSRYAAIREALVGPAGVVTTHQTQSAFGAMLYAGAPVCPAIDQVARTMNSQDAIAALIDSQMPEGSTPTAPAMSAAIDAFAAAPPPPGSTPP